MRLVWLLWFVLFITAFAVLEWYALTHEGGITLSQTIADLSYAWPPVVFLFGLVTGILVAHFWWPWLPKQKREELMKGKKDV